MSSICMYEYTFDKSRYNCVISNEKIIMKMNIEVDIFWIEES